MEEKMRELCTKITSEWDKKMSQSQSSTWMRQQYSKHTHIKRIIN